MLTVVGSCRGDTQADSSSRGRCRVGRHRPSFFRDLSTVIVGIVAEVKSFRGVGSDGSFTPRGAVGKAHSRSEGTSVLFDNMISLQLSFVLGWCPVPELRVNDMIVLVVSNAGPRWFLSCKIGKPNHPRGSVTKPPSLGLFLRPVYYDSRH